MQSKGFALSAIAFSALTMPSASFIVPTSSLHCRHFHRLVKVSNGRFDQFSQQNLFRSPRSLARSPLLGSMSSNRIKSACSGAAVAAVAAALFSSSPVLAEGIAASGADGLSSTAAAALASASAAGGAFLAAATGFLMSPEVGSLIAASSPLASSRILDAMPRTPASPAPICMAAGQGPRPVLYQDAHRVGRARGRGGARRHRRGIALRPPRRRLRRRRRRRPLAGPSPFRAFVHEYSRKNIITRCA